MIQSSPCVCNSLVVQRTGIHSSLKQQRSDTPLLTEVINDKGVCRTATASPGLLIFRLHNWTFTCNSSSLAPIALALLLSVPKGLVTTRDCGFSFEWKPCYWINFKVFFCQYLFFEWYWRIHNHIFKFLPFQSAKMT